MLDGKPLLTAETPESRKARADDNWEPDWIEDLYAGNLKCGRCRGHSILVAMATHSITQEFSGGGMRFVDELTLRMQSITPMPMVFIVPSDVPESACRVIREAFALIWSSPAGCLARLRAAIELVLDDKRVPRRARNSKPVGTRKTHRLNLHERIELFEDRQPDVASFLKAAKWLGNEGAHETPDFSTVLIACNLVEAALAEIYERRTKTLKATASAINKKKGAIGRRRPR